MKNHEKIAAKIARELFKLGDEPDAPCVRIAFKGKVKSGSEREQGGFSQTSLCDFISELLETYEP